MVSWAGLGWAGLGCDCLWGLLKAQPTLSPAGTLKLMEEADKLLWSVQVDHQLFALEKLDVTVSRNMVEQSIGAFSTEK
jgi:hypothetical protein